MPFSSGNCHVWQVLPIFWSSRDPRKPMEQKIERETMRKMDLHVDLSKTEPYRALRASGGFGKRERELLFSEK